MEALFHWEHQTEDCTEFYRRKFMSETAHQTFIRVETCGHGHVVTSNRVNLQTEFSSVFDNTAEPMSPSMQEVQKAIQDFKNNKSNGSNDIPSDSCKNFVWQAMLLGWSRKHQQLEYLPVVQRATEKEVVPEPDGWT